MIGGPLGRRRAMLPLGALLAGLVQACVEIPRAGSAPSSAPDPGRYPDYDRAYDDDAEWERREHRRYGCGEIEERLRFDKQKIDTIDPVRHHKALQWYKDDLRLAEREAQRCADEWRGAEEQRQREWRDRERRDQERRERRREQCAKIEDRIRQGREKIAAADPSKHRKALERYEDELRHAERDLENCRRR